MMIRRIYNFFINYFFGINFEKPIDKPDIDHISKMKKKYTFNNHYCQGCNRFHEDDLLIFVHDDKGNVYDMQYLKDLN